MSSDHSQRNATRFCALELPRGPGILGRCRAPHPTKREPIVAPKRVFPAAHKTQTRAVPRVGARRPEGLKNKTAWRGRFSGPGAIAVCQAACLGIVPAEREQLRFHPLFFPLGMQGRVGGRIFENRCGRTVDTKPTGLRGCCVDRILAISLLLGGAPAAAAPDTLVVCPAEWHEALMPWARYRREQGHELAVTRPPATAAELHDAIRRVAELGGLKYVVLIGDVADVPTHYVAARVNVRWGSEPTIAT